MQTILVFIAVLHFAAAGSILDEWRTWKTNHDKIYTDGEETQRFKIWQKTREFINSHNELFEAGNSTFRMKLNAFADKTEGELRELLSPFSRENTTDKPESAGGFRRRKPESLPDSIDWRDEGYVTPVKDQGPIGSCYAFSALGALEGQHFKETGKLISLSAQQVVDCDQGSDGGYTTKVYQYAMRVGGIQSEKSYPYTAKAHGTCTFDACEIVATVESYEIVQKRGDEDALKKAVATVGPISVSSIEVFLSFNFYDSGIYYERKCGTRQNPVGYHAMVAVGYGTEDGEDYWIVKNSWGPYWGEKGYVRMSRNRGNNCGIASDASYPISGGGNHIPRCDPHEKDRALLETTTKGAGTRLVSTLCDVLLSTIILAVLL